MQHIRITYGSPDELFQRVHDIMARDDELCEMAAVMMKIVGSLDNELNQHLFMSHEELRARLDGIRSHHYHIHGIAADIYALEAFFQPIPPPFRKNIIV